MKVKGEDLVSLIEEYFNQELPRRKEKHPDGVDSAAGSLADIVDYLKARCRKEGLGDISELTKIEDAKSTPEERQKRNINDRVRRALRKHPTISETKGKTTRKRYTMELGDSLRPIEKLYFDVFVHTEVQGGTVDLSKLIQLLLEDPLETGFYVHTEEIESNLKKSISNLVSDRELIGQHTQGLPPPFNIIDGNKITSSFNDWYATSSNWMGTKYYGFNGPRGLDSILNNIGKLIKNNQLSEVAEASRLDNEIEWLRAKKVRLSNKVIITLALLHLNRTLQGSVDNTL